MKTTVHNPDLARFVEAGTLYLSAPEAAELVRIFAASIRTAENNRPPSRAKRSTPNA